MMTLHELTDPQLLEDAAEALESYNEIVSSRDDNRLIYSLRLKAKRERAADAEMQTTKKR